MFRAILLALALATVNGLAVPSVIAQRLTLLTEELPPLNFTDQGALTGLSVDVVHEIQRRVGNTDPIEVVPWARGYKDIQEMPNTVLFSTTRTEDRERLFQWVGPLARWEYVFYKKRGSSITLDTLDAARDVGSIATYRDDAREQFLKERGFTNLDSSPKPMSCARKLLEGRVDLWLDSNLTADQVIRQIGFNPNEIEPVLTIKTNYLYIAFSRGTPATIVRDWQSTLDDMNRDGTFGRIYQRWLPKATPPASDGLRAEARRMPINIYTENLPPFNYLETGQIKGLSVDLVNEITHRVGAVKPIQEVPWSRGYQKALEEPNVALFSTARSKQRENLFKWVGPLATSASLLYARQDSNFKVATLDDAKLVESIGTYKDDTDEQFLREQGFTNLYSHGNPLGIIRNLMAGRIRLGVLNDYNAPLCVRQAGFQLDDIKPVLTAHKTSLYIAFSLKTLDALVQLWQDALDGMHEDGTFERIHQYWLRKIAEASFINTSGG